jgi:hypothetical protein
MEPYCLSDACIVFIPLFTKYCKYLTYRYTNQTSSCAATIYLLELEFFVLLFAASFALRIFSLLK